MAAHSGGTARDSHPVPYSSATKYRHLSRRAYLDMKSTIHPGAFAPFINPLTGIFIRDSKFPFSYFMTSMQPWTRDYLRSANGRFYGNDIIAKSRQPLLRQNRCVISRQQAQRQMPPHHGDRPPPPRQAPAFSRAHRYPAAWAALNLPSLRVLHPGTPPEARRRQ